MGEGGLRITSGGWQRTHGCRLGVVKGFNAGQREGQE